MPPRKPPGRAETSRRFDYGALDSETRQFVAERAEKIHHLARMAATGIMAIGQYLTETKERLPRGKFLEWIEREFAWKQAQAYRFMQVYENVKITNLINLEIDAAALYLIAAPSTPEPVRAEVIRRAESGEPVSNAGAHALKQAFEETGALPAPARSLPEIIEARRPVELPPAADRFQELAEAVRFIATMRDVPSDTWCSLFSICAFDFERNLNRALDYLSSLRRAHPHTEAS